MKKSEKKHHYRAIAKSDHLGVADLEDFIEEKKPLIFTIEHVKQEMGVTVAGKKGNYNIAYFKEKIKPLVLNQTNSKIIKGFAGSPFVEDWNNITIELYIDETVRMKGELVGGVRVRPTQPKAKSKPLFTVENFEKAHKAGATVEMIKAIYELTEEIEKQYQEYGAKN